MEYTNMTTMKQVYEIGPEEKKVTKKKLVSYVNKYFKKSTIKSYFLLRSTAENWEKSFK
ncbi:MAG: hypothetical protein IIZ39_09950 [Blautia sp.]|nr:hypothetical protein [Blautia sp.]